MSSVARCEAICDSISSDALDDVDGLDRYPILSEPFVLLLPERFTYTSPKPELKALAASHSLTF